MSRLFLLLALIPALACGVADGTGSAPAGSAPPPAVKENRPRVVLPDGFVVDVEIAATQETRALGLMYRESLPPGKGMLFLFPESGVYPFWMKDTLIPLDIIWLEATGEVVHVEENVPPCRRDPCPSVTPPVEASRVLELAAGQADAHGVARGAQLRIENVGQYRAR